MRILSLIVGSALVLFLVLAILRFWGLGQVFSIYQTDLQKKDLNWNIIDYSDVGGPRDVNGPFIWLDVHRTPSGDLVVKNSSDQLPLTTVFSNLPARFFHLQILESRDGIHEDVIRVVESSNVQDRIVIQSPTDVVLRAIKKRKPLWTYGISQSDLLRLKAFESMWVLPSHRIPGDVLIIPVTWRKQTILSSELVQELARQKKQWIVGPVQNDLELEKASVHSPKWIFFRRF